MMLRFQLQMIWGNMTPLQPCVSVPLLEPEAEGIVTLELIAPTEPGNKEIVNKIVK